MTTINSKILIGRQDQGIRKGLRHPHEASVGEARGNIGILLHQLLDRTQVFAKLEGNAQGGAPKQSAETWSARLSKKVVRLGQHRFAGGPRWRRAAHLGHGPLVMSIAVIEQRHQEAGINENVSCHSLRIANTSRQAVRQPTR